MAATVTTNDPNGLGYQAGFFSGAPGAPLNQSFFNAAFAGHINSNKIYKEAYHCNILQNCTMSTWLDEYMGYETDCFPDYSLIETNSYNQQIKVKTTVTIGANPATGIIAIDTASMYVSGNYILPQVGNTIVLSPNGYLAEVTAVTNATSGDFTITVRIRNTGVTATVTAGDTLLVLSGSFIADCACPTGQFAVPDMPIIHDLSMITIGDKGEICGDALNKCQWLKIPFTDGCGNTIENWYTQALSDMYRRFEDRKHFERLFNPSWGIIPTIKARGIKFTPASSSELTTDDFRAWKAALDLAGINCREFAVFAGGRIFSQAQRMLLTAGVTQLTNQIFPNGECKWIDMEYCGISIEGMKLHFYDECSFSNGKLLGGPNMVYPNSAIFVPLCARRACTRSDGRTDTGGSDDRMLSTVYFRSKDGRVWDNLTDSNGILGPRNTFGTGCEEHEWTIKSRFLQEIHCPQSWGYMGL